MHNITKFQLPAIAGDSVSLALGWEKHLGFDLFVAKLQWRGYRYWRCFYSDELCLERIDLAKLWVIYAYMGIARNAVIESLEVEEWRL